MEFFNDRRALLIGVDRYPFFPPENQLRGCRNDVALVKEFLLEGWRFPAENVRELLDEAATRDVIRLELAALAAAAREGCLTVIYFSGHGSRRPDGKVGAASPDARAGDEEDGWDETLVPHDSGRGAHPSKDLGDDEIRGHLKNILDRGARLLFIADSCRSGTVFRDPDDGTRIRQVPADERPPAAAIDYPAIDQAELFAAGRLNTLCACHDHQWAIELETGGQVNGAFTYHLVRALASVPPGATFSDLRERMLLRLRSGFSNQWPRFEGDLGGALPERNSSYRPAGGLADFAKRRLKFELPAEPATLLREALARSPWIEELPARSSAWAKLEWSAAPRETLLLPADDRHRFILSRSGGDPVLVSDDFRPEAVIAALERQARHAYLLALENADPAQILAASCELSLFSAAGERGPFRPIAESGGLAALYGGERLGIRLANRGEQPLHLGVLLFGTSGEVAALHPPRATAPPLAPGCTLELGMGFRWSFTLAAHRPPWRTPPACGDIEQVKVFASRDPWPWTAWLNDLRDRPLPPPAAGAWTTFSRSFLLLDRIDPSTPHSLEAKP